jgi:hypothetical protein
LDSADSDHPFVVLAVVMPNYYYEKRIV